MLFRPHGGIYHSGSIFSTKFVLLPEGAALEEILSAIHMRDASTFEIIGQLGEELPGVLSVRAEGNGPSEQQYSAMSKAN